MRQHITNTALSLGLAASPGLAEERQFPLATPPVSKEHVLAVAPALSKYTDESLFGEVWNRPALSKRDRSIVTVGALIARNQTVGLAFHLDLALENGVEPAELSEMITHLSFYSGWANAIGAVAIAKDVFAARGIGANQIPIASPTLLPLDEEKDAPRQNTVAQTVAPTFPGLAGYTNGLLFKDLWLRPNLSPRDRGLITVTSLIANGEVGQITYHLNRAMDNGLTRDEASEMLTQLAFYAGWPNVFSAAPVVKDVLDKRS